MKNESAIEAENEG